MPALGTLTDHQFNQVVTLAKARWGLSITPSKLQLVTTRLASFVRGSRFSNVTEYLRHVENGATEEDLLCFFDLLSTNVTSFFRDKPHFDYLERELFTALARGNLTLPGRKLRMWSAGCSTGCEPYTMAMVAHEHMSGLSGWDTKILATDLSNYAVAQARAAEYRHEEVKDIPADLREQHFERKEDGWSVKPHLRSMVSVAQLNLMAEWPMRGSFDVIFCRNVMIYFDAPTREKLVARFVRLLRPGGILAVGSAETLAGMNVGLRTAMASLYVK